MDKKKIEEIEKDIAQLKAQVALLNAFNHDVQNTLIKLSEVVLKLKRVFK